MSYLKLLPITILATFLAGCSSTANMKDPAVRNAINQVKYIESTDGLDKYATLGTVEARYCQSNQISLTQLGSITREGAITEMRYLASQKGGNALINVTCQSDGVDFGTNCNNSIACYGDAIKY